MIPVILDPDLGTDIDDHWAIAMLLASPELDVRLITTDSGDTTYRAQLLAGLLTAAGRTDIPIGVGVPTSLPDGVPLHIIPGAAARNSLDKYAGTVHPDGVQAIIDAVRTSLDPVTILTIGPVTNLAAALERDPAITHNSRIIAMAGWLRTTDADHPMHGEATGPQKEYNVIVDIAAFRAVLASDWEIALSPIDSCGRIVLDGDRYARIRASGSPLLHKVSQRLPRVAR